MSAESEQSLSIKTEAQDVVNTYFADNADADKMISATQLSDLVERDAKTVRAHLRKIAARDQSELHGARWRITKTVATQVVERYMRLSEQDESADSAASAS